MKKEREVHLPFGLLAESCQRFGKSSRSRLLKCSYREQEYMRLLLIQEQLEGTAPIISAEQPADFS